MLSSSFEFGANLGIQQSIEPRSDHLMPKLKYEDLPKPEIVGAWPWVIDQNEITWQGCGNGRIFFRLYNAGLSSNSTDPNLVEIALQCQDSNGIWHTTRSEVHQKSQFRPSPQSPSKQGHGIQLDTPTARRCRIVIFDPSRIRQEDDPRSPNYRAPTAILINNIQHVGPQKYDYINHYEIEISPCRDQYKVHLKRLYDDAGNDALNTVEIRWPGSGWPTGSVSPWLPASLITIARVIDEYGCESNIYFGPFDFNALKVEIISAFTDCTETNCTYEILISNGAPPYRIKLHSSEGNYIYQDFFSSSGTIELSGPCNQWLKQSITVEELETGCKSSIEVPSPKELDTNSDIPVSIGLSKSNDPKDPCRWHLTLYAITYSATAVTWELYYGEITINADGVVEGGELIDKNRLTTWNTNRSISKPGHYTVVFRSTTDARCMGIKKFYIPPCMDRFADYPDHKDGGFNSDLTFGRTVKRSGDFPPIQQVVPNLDIPHERFIQTLQNSKRVSIKSSADSGIIQTSNNPFKRTIWD